MRRRCGTGFRGWAVRCWRHGARLLCRMLRRHWTSFRRRMLRHRGHRAVSLYGMLRVLHSRARFRHGGHWAIFLRRPAWCRSYRTRCGQVTRHGRSDRTHTMIGHYRLADNHLRRVPVIDRDKVSAVDASLLTHLDLSRHGCRVGFAQRD